MAGERRSIWLKTFPPGCHDRGQLVAGDGAQAGREGWAWRKVQLAERMARGSAWTDSGRVFTREDGTPLRPGWVSTRFDTLATKAGLPPVTFHGLRHSSATMARAAGVDIKTISEMLGHSTVSFIDDVYTSVAEEMAEEAASTIAAYVSRRGKVAGGRASNVPAGGADDH